ncbi:MAG TPA: VWA domain-containing protein [Caldilineaceae bacterium]|nr:VWA domain-containing protein [Caldilineaceae bacterium]
MRDYFVTEDNRQSGQLLRNAVLFGRMLRALGIEVTPTQMVDLVDSLHFVDIRSRRDFKHSARAVLVNQREQIPLFDEAFDLFWQARREGELLELDLGTLLQKHQQQEMELYRRNPSAGESQSDSQEPEEERLLTYSDRELLRQKDFARLDDEELVTVQRMMQGIQWQLEPRRTRRHVRARQGQLIDLRRTMRQTLRHGGEVMQFTYRERKTKRRPVVLICDISGSMERYSRVLLQFIYIVTSRLDRVESFVFSTRLTRITRQLQRRNIDDALREASAVVHDWAGGTRIGEAIRTFNYDWARRVLNQGAVVMIISDGWDRGDVQLLGREMDRLHRSCHRLIWLNPLLGAEDYQPLVRGIQAALPHIDDFLPVHNLASLEQLAAILY